MKKYILPILVVAAFGAYVLLSSQKSVQVATTPSAGTTPDTGSATPSAGTQGSSPAAGTPTPTSTQPAVSGQYKDGSYKGSPADAYFGNLQVEAIITGGKLTDVQFLQYPNDNRESVSVSNNAMPQLKQEAIQSQSAQVNIVSGATQTSEAFQQSLASALKSASI